MSSPLSAASFVTLHSAQNPLILNTNRSTLRYPAHKDRPSSFCKNSRPNSSNNKCFARPVGCYCRCRRSMPAATLPIFFYFPIISSSSNIISSRKLKQQTLKQLLPTQWPLQRAPLLVSDRGKLASSKPSRFSGKAMFRILKTSNNANFNTLKPVLKKAKKKYVNFFFNFY